MRRGWRWLPQKYRVRWPPQGHAPANHTLQVANFQPTNRRCCERYLRYKGACLEAVRSTRQVTIITIERSLSLSSAFFQEPVLRSQGLVVFATARLQRSQTA